jgi:hypothetical protein
VIAKEVKPNEIAFLQKSFGEQFNALFEDYRKNNRVEYLVKEKIRIPYVSVMTKEQKEKMQAEEKRTFSFLEAKSTDSVVAAIVKACEAKRPRLRYVAPWIQGFGVRMARIFGV